MKYNESLQSAAVCIAMQIIMLLNKAILCYLIMKNYSDVFKIVIKSNYL